MCLVERFTLSSGENVIEAELTRAVRYHAHERFSSETETLHTMSETKSPASAAFGVDAPRHEPAYVLAFDTANEVIAVGVGVLHEEAHAIELVAHAEIEARRQSNTQLIPRIDALLA